MKNEENIAHLYFQAAKGAGGGGESGRIEVLVNQKWTATYFFLQYFRYFMYSLLREFTIKKIYRAGINNLVSEAIRHCSAGYQYCSISPWLHSSEHKLLKGNFFYQETPQNFNILFILLDHLHLSPAEFSCAPKFSLVRKDI